MSKFNNNNSSSSPRKGKQTKKMEIAQDSSYFNDSSTYFTNFIDHKEYEGLIRS